MTIFLSGAVLSALICAGTQVGQQTAEQAGAALAAGRAEEAAASAVACLPDPACALVRGRALLALGSFEQAAQALRLARSGETAVHAAKLEGESLVLAGQGGAAMEPLQFAAQHDPDGPAGVRAAALLADAFLEVGRFADAADQARKAAENPSQPNDVRVGLDLIGAEALSARVDAGEVPLARDAALQWRAFWLEHPEHPAAEGARAEEQRLAALGDLSLAEPIGRELLSRAQRLLAAGKPGAAVAQAEAAAKALRGAEAAEAQLAYAPAPGADCPAARRSAWSRRPLDARMAFVSTRPARRRRAIRRLHCCGRLRCAARSRALLASAGRTCAGGRPALAPRDRDRSFRLLRPARAAAARPDRSRAAALPSRSAARTRGPDSAPAGARLGAVPAGVARGSRRRSRSLRSRRASAGGAGAARLRARATLRPLVRARAVAARVEDAASRCPGGAAGGRLSRRLRRSGRVERRARRSRSVPRAGHRSSRKLVSPGYPQRRRRRGIDAASSRDGAPRRRGARTPRADGRGHGRPEDRDRSRRLVPLRVVGPIR